MDFDRLVDLATFDDFAGRYSYRSSGIELRYSC